MIDRAVSYKRHRFPAETPAAWPKSQLRSNRSIVCAISGKPFAPVSR